MPPTIISRVAAALAILTALLENAGTAQGIGMIADGTTAGIAAKADPAPNESGIAGQVSIRPVRPHETIGVPNVTPYQAKLTVFDQSGGQVATVETDPDGNFRIALPPGKYVLRPESPALYPRAAEQTVIVPPKSFTRVRVVYDSGIR
jgi:Carboxypeptidase regulatory-like domain